MSDSEETYFGIGKIVALPAFFCSWWYCAEHWGFLFGFGLGWLPAGIVAALIVVLWPIALFVFWSALSSPTTEGAFWKLTTDIAVWEVFWIGLLVVCAILAGAYHLLSVITEALDRQNERKGPMSKRGKVVAVVGPTLAVVTLFAVSALSR